MKTKLLLIGVIVLSAFSGFAQTNYWTEIPLPTDAKTTFGVSPDNTTYFASGSILGGSPGRLHSKTGSGAWTSISTNLTLSHLVDRLYVLSATDLFILAHKSGQSNYRIMKSADAGANWTCVDSTVAYYYQRFFKGGNNLYMYGINGGDYLRISKDNGQTWTITDSTYKFRSVAYNGTKLYATLSLTMKLVTSTDLGKTWTSNTLTGFLGSPYFVAATQNGTVYLSSASTSIKPGVSPDGINFTSTTAPFNEIMFTTSLNHFLAYEPYSGISLSTNGGVTCTNITAPLVLAISTANISEHYTSDDGSVYLQVTSNAGNKIYKFEITLGVDDINVQPKFINVYPNPATETISIDLKNNTGITSTVTISNTLGETVFTSADQLFTGTVNVKNFSAGFYFVNIKRGDITYTGKFVKE